MIKKYTIEQWTSIGLLNTVPIDRKQLVTNKLNYVYNYLINDIDDHWDILIWIFPIIIRITKVIDINNNQIIEIINEIIKKRKKFLIKTPLHLENNLEKEFVKDYCNNKIKSLSSSIVN